jgi:hypothetical protein
MRLAFQGGGEVRLARQGCAGLEIESMPGLRQIYRRIRFGEPVVVVSGLPRSGTSMTMKMLEAGGVNLVTDGFRTADEDNPKGYYEYELVKELDKEADKAWLRDTRGKAIKIISFLLRHLPSSNNYKVVFMQRNLEEVLASQSKMLDRRGEANQTDDDDMRHAYQDHLWKVDYLMKHAPQFETLALHYKEVLEEPRRQAARINAFLDGRLDVDRMVDVVDEQLYRNRR